MTVKLDNIERNAWVTRLRAGDYDVTVFPGAGTNVPSANMAFVAGPKPPQGTNYSYASDPIADADLAAALSASEADRCRAWSKLQIQLLANFDVLPLAAPTFATFTQANVAATVIGSTFDTSTVRRVR